MSERRPAPPTLPDERDDEWERCHLYALTDEIGWCGLAPGRWDTGAGISWRDLVRHYGPVTERPGDAREDLRDVLARDPHGA
jgi:hypothetical protein